MASIKGKWVFNAFIEPAGAGTITFDVNFVSNSQEWEHMKSWGIDYELYYGISSNWITPFTGSYWTDQAYRTVDFGSADQTVSDTFYNWFTANAVPEQTEPIITPTIITYNGTELASLEGGQTANFDCEGKKAAGAVSILFGSKGSITYKGVTTEIEKGKTANLLCAGKKFATDVVVAVEKVIYIPAGTYVAKDSFTAVPMKDIGTQDITFTSSNTEYSYMKPDNYVWGHLYYGTTLAYNFSSAQNKYYWVKDAYKTVTISKDQEVSEKFKAWFDANYTGKDELAGTWYFNATIDFSYETTAIPKYFDFICNGVNYNRIKASGDGYMVYLVDDDWSTAVFAYDFDWKDIWENEAYRTIKITSKLADVTDGEAFLAWLKANATKQSDE